jgi:predicted transcriptional regulator
MGEDRTGRPAGRPVQTEQRVTVREAADLLGITAEAVRMRIKRGTLHSERHSGRVFVLLGPDQPTKHTTERTEPTEDRTAELIATLREQLAEEREARRRADTIIAQLARTTEEQARTIRELEAPASGEAQEAAETVEEEPERAEPHPNRVESPEAVQRSTGRSLWRRIFRVRG